MNIDEMKRRIEENKEKYLSIIRDALNNQFGKEFGISSSKIEPVRTQNEVGSIEGPVVALQLHTTTGVDNQHLFLFDPKLVLQIVAWLIEEEVDETITDEHLDGLKELVNQIMGQLQSTLSGDSVSLAFEIKDPVFKEAPDSELFRDMSGQAMKTTYTLSAEGLEYSVYHYLWMETEDFQSGSADQDNEIYPADFQTFNTASVSSDKPRNIEMLMDVQLEIYVELGRKSMFIKDILKLSKGSVVELEKAAGEPLGVFVNGRKFAEGEVVVVDDQFGVRITQLIGPQERIKSLV